MKNVWVIVANAENANIYSISDKKMQFKLIKRLTHIESKLKKTNLVSDRPGHYAKGYGNKLRGSYSRTTDPKLVEIEHFVHEICQFLEKGRVENLYVGLIIVANPHLYGLIKQFSNRHLVKYIKDHVAKEYTREYTGEQDKILQYKLKTDLSHKLNLIFIST